MRKLEVPVGTQASVRVRWSAERIFFTGMAVALFAAVFLGFARSYFLRPLFPEFREQTPKELFFYVHGAVFALWYLLFMVQTTLVARRRVDLHRKLGWYGAALAAAMVVVGFWGALIAARRPGGFLGIPIPPKSFLIVPFFDVLLFTLFIGLAVLRRRDAQAHKRWMLIGSISIVTAAVARWPFAFMAGGPPAFFAVTDAFLLPLVAWDLATRRRPHPATIVGALVLIASQPLRLVLSGTSVWQRFAEWLIG